MIRILPVIFLALCLGCSNALKQDKVELPVISLYIVHDENPDNGVMVTTSSKSSKGYIASEPDMKIAKLQEVLHLEAPKFWKRDADGHMVETSQPAELLLDLLGGETEEFKTLRTKVGKNRLYLKVVNGDLTRYFDVQLNKVGDSSFFVNGREGEKAELAMLLSLLEVKSDE